MESQKADKKTNNSEIFKFPLSSDGLESVRSVFELMGILEAKFKKAYKNSPEIVCQYQFSFPRFYSYVQGLQYIKLVAHCKYCSHQLIYFKNLSFEQSYKLISFRNYHVHTRDPKKIREAYLNSCRDTPKIYRYQPYGVKLLKIKNEKSRVNMSPEEFIKDLPVYLRLKTKLKLANEKFGITEAEFNSILRKINSEYDITFKQLIQDFDEKEYSYAYVPKNMLEAEKRVDVAQSLPRYSYRPPEEAPDCEQFCPDEKSIHFFDKDNPHLPNILVIVTPQMKVLYEKFGQYVGFDLTFSIIKEKPSHHKEYLIGVLAGTNQSKRCMVFGIVITNCQSVEAYKFIFREFFTMMGHWPTCIYTDEEKAMFYAIRQLQQEGLYKGIHLLDMFHVLKKFRTAADGHCFQVYRKLMHARNRIEYRSIFKELKKIINNDKELDILRVFDQNSDKYCFSQVPEIFMGVSISNSFNEMFHEVLKGTVPYSTTYIKGVNQLIRVATKMNDPKEPDIDMHPFEQNLNIPYLKPYRTLFSSSIFKIILRGVAKAGKYNILTAEQEGRGNLKDTKIQQGQLSTIQSLNKQTYYVKTQFGIHKIFKVYGSNEYSILNVRQRECRGKWICSCGWQEKTGVPCEHLIKVLVTLGEDLLNNFHPRWLIKHDQLTDRLIKYRYHNKFLKLRARHKIHLRGTKNSRYLLDHFGKQHLYQSGSTLGATQMSFLPKVDPEIQQSAVSSYGQSAVSQETMQSKDFTNSQVIYNENQQLQRSQHDYYDYAYPINLPEENYEENNEENPFRMSMADVVDNKHNQ